MKEGPDIAGIAALIGDPARANILSALMAGMALTAGELAGEAGVTPQTASGHLARLVEAGLLLVLAVDHVLDMGRSATNIVGNAVACVVVNAWEARKQALPDAAAAG